MSAFEMTADEAQVASTARSYLADFVDNSYLNQQELSERGYDRARWEQMCGLGWASVHLPARVGGGGGTLTDSALIARECGRAAYASPLLQTLRVGALLTSIQSDKGFDDVLTSIAQGQPAALVAPPDRMIRAEPAQGGYRLTGAPTVVEWLNHVDSIVLLVPTSDRDRWLCAVLAKDGLAGRCVNVPSIDNERAARLDLDGMRLPAEAVRAADIPSRAAQRAIARANLLRASAMVGGCEDVLARTARYALERHQFGQPVGAFQAARHHLARMVIATDGARLLCDDALTRAETERDESAIAAAALFAAGRSYVEVVLTGAQLHGGVGTTVEHIMHHHFRRAKAMQLRSGKRANRLRELGEALIQRQEGSLW